MTERCIYCGSSTPDGYCWLSEDGGHVMSAQSLLAQAIQTGYEAWSLVPDRKTSPEVDFGVNWLLNGRDRFPKFPSWRVSWLEKTGELCATPTADRKDRFAVFPVTFPTREDVEDAMNSWADPLSSSWQNLTALWVNLILQHIP